MTRRAVRCYKAEVEAEATHPDDLAADATMVAEFRAQIHREVARRMPNAVGLFVSMMGAAFAIALFHHPNHFAELLLCITVLVATCLAGVVAVRRSPEYAASIALTTISVLVAGLAIYIVRVEDSGELCLLAMIGYLTGLVVQFPWGPRYQAAAAAVVIAAYFCALAAGVAQHLPIAYGLFALTTHALMTIIGASLLDAYRWSAFREAAEAERMASEAARANRAKTDFLATVSHELRTPLNIIFGYTDLLIEDAFERAEERGDALRRIRSQSGNLLDMIQAMLDINKLEAGGISVDTSEFQLGDLMTRMRGAIPASWCKKGVDLVWESRGDEALLHSDADKIEIVLRNLVHNALKYTDQGEVRVYAAATPGNCQVDFSVTDTGQGIPPDDLERIFQMFQQSGDGPPRQGGVGLGLFLARQLSAALGGTLRAESTLGVGSRFTLALPLRVPSDDLAVAPTLRAAGPW